MIRVLIADDSPTYSRTLSFGLRRDPEIKVVGTVATAEDAVELSQRLNPHVVVLDLGLPQMGSVEACRRIVAASPGVVVVVLTGRSMEHLDKCLNAGASGYMLKKEALSDPLHVAAALRNARRGDVVLGRDLVEEARHRARQRRAAAARPRGKPLTEAEQEVLEFLARGYQDKEIARKRGASVRTVEHQVASILAKLSASNRTGAVAIGRELGYLP